MKRNKGYFLAIFAIIAILFLTNDFGLVNVQKTAIITAVAIDKEEDDYLLTAQIAIAQPSAEGKSVEPIEVTGKGKTVSKALSEIGDKTGRFPKLIYCHLILLGESSVSENVFSSLDFFLRNEYMSDNALLAQVNGRASDIFKPSTPANAVSAIAIQKLMSTEARESGKIAATNLKTFAVGYYGEGKSGYMPILSFEDLSGENGSESNSKSSPSSQSKDGKIFSANRTALFKEGVKVGELSEEETFALNLVSHKVRIADTEVESGGETYALSLKGNKPKISVAAKKERPLLTLRLKLTASVSGKSSPSSVGEISRSSAAPEEVRCSAEKKLEGLYLDLVEKSKALDCDFLNLTDRIKRNDYGGFFTFKDSLLPSLEADISVKIRSGEKNL